MLSGPKRTPQSLVNLMLRTNCKLTQNVAVPIAKEIYEKRTKDGIIPKNIYLRHRKRTHL